MGNEAMRLLVGGGWNPLKDHSADPHPLVADLGGEREQTGAEAFARTMSEEI